jgi:CHAT domain-containing protein/Tfp pilus assembly protein PilF
MRNRTIPLIGQLLANWFGLCSIVLSAGEPTEQPAAPSTAAPADRSESSNDFLLTEAQQLDDRSLADRQQGRYPEALAAGRRALEIRKQVLGDRHANTATSLVHLGATLSNMGQYDEARQCLEQALAVRKELFGEKNGAYLEALNDLGLIFHSMGQYEQAVSLLGRSLSLRWEVFGPQHLNVALAMNNMACVFEDIGHYASARQLHESALAIRRKQLGEAHPVVGASLNNLGLVLQKMGDHQEARRCHEQSLEIARKTQGEEHPETANRLNNLGLLLANTGDSQGAIELYRKALAIQTKTLGEAHPNTLRTLHNLGSQTSATGEYQAARDYLQRAVDLRRRTLGESHPDVAFSLNDLAGVLASLEEDAAAEACYEEALAIRRRTLGEEHCDTGVSAANLARLFAMEGRIDQAVDMEDRARRAVRQHVASVLGGLPESEQLWFLYATDRGQFHTALSLGWTHRADRAARERSATWLLNGKALAQEALTHRTRIVPDEHYAWFSDQLRTVRRQLAAAALDGSDMSAARRRELEALRAREQELARHLALISRRPDERAPWIELDAVRKRIAADAVLIEMARFEVHDFRVRGKSGRWRTTRYAAWVIPPEGEGERDIELVDLGEAAALEAAIEESRSLLSRAPERCRELGEPDAERELVTKMRTLADELWQPLAPHVGSAKKIILSPDSALWLVPWAALPLGDDHYLVEDVELQYVVSGRDLLAEHRPSQGTGRSLILADPDFDLLPRDAESELRRLVPQAVDPAPGDTRGALVTTRLPHVNRLPGTGAEAALVAPKLERYTHVAPDVRTNRQALEGVLKWLPESRPSPEVIVLSTHGYFLPDGTLSLADGQPLSLALQNPLLRCGLLLAGCNQPHAAGQDDGVLTGLEIVGLDLRGTRLVVLSACETGVGQIHSGEGVAGIRQAFQLAGAASVVATLWQVPDRESVQLMSTFFENLEETAPSALREAQLALIRGRRERFEAAHPFFWAAFTVTGR